MTNAPSKRNALVYGEQDDTMLYPGEKIAQDPLLSNVEASAVTVYASNDARSSNDSVGLRLRPRRATAAGDTVGKPPDTDPRNVLRSGSAVAS